MQSKRQDTAVEVFEVENGAGDAPDDEPVITTVHLVEQWGTGHPPKDRIRRRTLRHEDKATPDTKGGYVTHTRGMCVVDGVAFEVKEMYSGHVADNYDDAEDGDTRWWLRQIDVEDGHEEPPVDKFGDS